MTGRIKKAMKQRELDALVFNVLASFSAMQWTEWWETTRIRRGKVGLGTGTFSEIVKRLMAEGRVEMDGDGCYRVAEDAVKLITAENSPAVDTGCFSEVSSEVFREAGNGNADVADMALQQLLDREVQD